MFFYSILCANSIFLSVFTASLFTSYTVCTLFNLPFYNKEKNEIEDNIEKIKQNCIPVYFACTYMILLTLQTLDTRPHSWIKTGFHISFYSTLIEGLYYCYHREIHSRFFYRYIHSEHYTKVTGYPLDALYINTFDLCSYLMCLHLPTYVLNLSMFEYVVVLYFYVTMGFFSHSPLAYQHHILHHKYHKYHKYYKYNFCLVFPIFDFLMETFNECLVSDTKKTDSVTSDDTPCERKIDSDEYLKYSYHVYENEIEYVSVSE